MATPALKDLPKVDMDLKSQLETFSPKNLKNASTEEKCVLPSAEGNYFFFLSSTFYYDHKIVDKHFMIVYPSLDPKLNQLLS